MLLKSSVANNLDLKDIFVCDITEILLKTALNSILSFSEEFNTFQHIKKLQQANVKASGAQN